MFVRIDAKYDDIGLWTGASIRNEGPNLGPSNVLSMFGEEGRSGTSLEKMCIPA